MQAGEMKVRRHHSACNTHNFLCRVSYAIRDAPESRFEGIVVKEGAVLCGDNEVRGSVPARLKAREIILRPRTELATLCTELWENKRGTYRNYCWNLRELVGTWRYALWEPLPDMGKL